MKHLVQFSTGIGSAEVAMRVVEQFGPKDVVLVTADTRVEDADNWRFAEQVVDYLAPVSWVRLSDGRTPMQAGRDARVVPNNRMAVCSRVLKRDLIRKHMDLTYDPEDSNVYLGFDWTEEHRFTASEPAWRPWHIVAPLMSAPIVTKAGLIEKFRGLGIEPPALYAQGFSHANCGGGCVRGGQAQWELLLRVNRDRYLEWEGEEQQTRELLGKDVTILRDRSGGSTRPLTLEAFRQRLESQPSLFDTEDWGACGCFFEEAA